MRRHENKIFLIKPEWMAAFFCFIVVLSKLVFDNIPILTQELIPVGDASADIIATHRVYSDYLLIGHYNTKGVNHFGPFFLYVRWLTELLAGPWLGSVFGAHLLATMLTNAASFALLAALLTRLAGGGARGAIAALTATFIVLLQFAGREWSASTFMSYVIIAPFWAFLAAAVLLLSGSVFGLVTAAFIGLILIHAYIPLAFIALFLFLFCFVCGRRERMRTTGRDFPAAAYLTIGTLALLFAAPIILDVLINPPGNIVKVFMLATDPAQPRETSFKMFTVFLIRTFLLVPVPLLLFVVLGAIIAIRTGRHGVLIRRLAVVSALVLAAAIVIYAPVPGYPREYQGVFLNGPLILAVAIGCMSGVLALWRINPKLAVTAMVGSLLFPVLLLSFSSPNTRWLEPELKQIARFIAAENPRDAGPGMVSIRGGKRIVSGLLVELEKDHLKVCSPDEKAEYYFTPNHICPPDSKGKIPSYKVIPAPPCINGTTAKPDLRSKLSPLGQAVLDAIDQPFFRPIGLKAMAFLRSPVPEKLTNNPADDCQEIEPPPGNTLITVCGFSRGCRALLRETEIP